MPGYRHDLVVVPVDDRAGVRGSELVPGDRVGVEDGQVSGDPGDQFGCGGLEPCRRAGIGLFAVAASGDARVGAHCPCRCLRASISAPTVSIPLIVSPIASNASLSGISMTFMSKYFSITVSPAGGLA